MERLLFGAIGVILIARHGLRAIQAKRRRRIRVLRKQPVIQQIIDKVEVPR